MNSAPRRIAPTFRETTSRDRSKRPFPWRILLSIVVGGAVLSGVIFFLSRQPRGYECLTTVNTLCPTEIERHFSSLRGTPIWKIQQHFVELQQENTDARLSQSSLSISPLQVAQVKVELADPYFPFSVENEHFQMLSNGKVFSSEAATFPNLELASVEQAQELSEEQREQLKVLYQRLRTFTPRIRKILVLTPTEVEVYPENAGKVLFTLQDVERQLTTLQAFFRSTTINQTYQVLDVRFSEVAVIKE